MATPLQQQQQQHTHTHVYNYKPTLSPPLLFKIFERLRAVEESTDLPTKIIYTQFKMYLKILVHPHPVYLFSTTSSFCSENLFRLCAFIAIQWKNCNEKVGIEQKLNRMNSYHKHDPTTLRQTRKISWKN